MLRVRGERGGSAARRLPSARRRDGASSKQERREQGANAVWLAAWLAAGQLPGRAGGRGQEADEVGTLELKSLQAKLTQALIAGVTLRLRPALKCDSTRAHRDPTTDIPRQNRYVTTWCPAARAGEGGSNQ